MMRAGEMRHRIGIHNLTSGSWTHAAWQFAEIMGRGSQPWFAKGMVQQPVSHYVRTRYNQQLLSRSRILAPAHGVTLAGLTTSGATSITLSSAFTGQAWPYYVRIEDEVLYVSAGFATTTLTVARGQFGTTAAAHSAGSAVIRCELLAVGSVDVLQQVNEQMVAYCTDVTKVMEGCLTQTCTIQRVSYGTGPQPTKTWATLASNIPIRMQQMATGAVEVNEPVEVTVAQFTAYLPYGTNITGRDRVVIGSATYECLSENADPGGYGGYMTVQCREVR